MKRDAPAVLRKGAVIRVTGTGADVPPAALAWAISYVDIQFDDGHVERWLGSGSLQDNPPADFLRDSE